MCHAADWKTTLENELPVLGHRNWIVIADSAYPAQTGGGIEVVATRADHFQVLETVLDALRNSRHVRPVFYMDSELAQVPEKDAPGVEAYRQKVAAILKGSHVSRLPHMDLIMKLDASAKNFRVLVLKTDLTLPYTSVFIELDCGYWSSEAEARLRQSMKKSGGISKDWGFITLSLRFGVCKLCFCLCRTEPCLIRQSMALHPAWLGASVAVPLQHSKESLWHVLFREEWMGDGI